MRCYAHVMAGARGVWDLQAPLATECGCNQLSLDLCKNTGRAYLLRHLSGPSGKHLETQEYLCLPDTCIHKPNSTVIFCPSQAVTHFIQYNSV